MVIIINNKISLHALLFISVIILFGSTSTASDTYNTGQGSVQQSINDDNFGFNSTDSISTITNSGSAQNSGQSTEEGLQGVTDATNSLPDKQKISQGEENHTVLNDPLTSVLSFKDVKEFGAVGDGLTDDTDAIRDALLSGFNIHFSSGVYVVSSTISVSGLDNLKLNGDNATITTNTNDLEFMFYFNNCTNLNITGIDFDSNNKGRSILNINNCPGAYICNCQFHDFKQGEDNTGNLRHALNFMYSNKIIVSNNYFYNIGQDINNSISLHPQYRCITLARGCNDAIIENNVMEDVYQGIVIAEYPVWISGVLYTTSNFVLYMKDGKVNVYQCNTNHTSSSQNVPPNSQYWTLIKSDSKPTYNTVFKNNVLHRVVDNGVYFLEYCKNILIDGNTFEDMLDEPVVIVGQNAVIVNNYFHNWTNKGIAIGTKDNLEKITIANNLFEQETGYHGSFIQFRETSMTYSVYQMNITNNTFKIADSIDNLSLVVLGKISQLNVNNNIFETNCERYEKIIRISNTVTTGLVTENIFKTTNSGAIIFYDVSVGSNIKLLNNVFIILPTIINVDPVNNAVINTTSKRIILTLSEPVKPGPAYSNITIKNSNGAKISITTSISTSGWFLFIDAKTYSDGKYTINLPKGSIADLAGNELANDYVSIFTVDTKPPTIRNIDPANNAVNIPVNKRIILTLSEPVKPGSAYKSITVKNSNGVVVPISTIISPSGWFLFIGRSNGTYTKGMTYIITIPAKAVKDLAGNGLSTSRTYYFTITTV